MNKTRKGNYYRLKTKKWLEKEGFQVETLEKTMRIFADDKRVIFIKKDLWGADLIASNGSELIIVQNKTNRTDVSKGIRELKAAPWPGFVKKWVVIWPPKAKEPRIVEV